MRHDKYVTPQAMGSHGYGGGNITVLRRGKGRLGEGREGDTTVYNEIQCLYFRFVTRGVLQVL